MITFLVDNNKTIIDFTTTDINTLPLRSYTSLEGGRNVGMKQHPSSLSISCKLERQNVLLVHSPSHINHDVLAGSELLMLESIFVS